MWRVFAAAALSMTACGGSEASGGPTPLDVDTTWTWQLLGDIDTSVDAELYDIDLFDAPDEAIEALRADGRIVVCYFSAGSAEDWRDDADAFDPASVGEPLDGWEGERWLDVRHPSVLAAAIDRLDVAVERGCDGVEPDNVDGYTNTTGFALTPQDQLAFNRALADAAHERGLLIGLKNDLDQIPELVDHFDFAIVEQCHEYEECGLVAPFVDAGKPVFVAEYDDRFVADPELICPAAETARLRTLILPLALDGSFRISCDDR